LNTPYNNIHNSRIDPSLNDKNNTNIVVNTAANEISPGDLNSVKRITQLLNLNLNSCFRSNYYQSNPCDFLYMLPSEIKNVTALRLVSIEIPNSWYLISNLKKNNIFEIVFTVPSNMQNPDTSEKQSGNTKCGYVIEIPDGNYDSETLQDFLNSTYFYQTSSSSEYFKTYLKYIKFSINPYNFKSTFELINQPEPGAESSDEDDDIKFSLKFSQSINQNIMNTFGWIIGFRMGNYVNIYESIISEGLFDAGGDRYIYVCINDYQYNTNPLNMVCFDKSVFNEDVIAKIPMVNGKLSLTINDNNNSLSKIRRYNGPVNLSRLQIKIVDHFGTVIDLNNMDFSITLELQVLYENFNFKNVSY
jgi:putative Mn2+ efflux pump MntP